MRTTVTIETDELPEITRDIREKLEAADESLRKSFAGLDVEDVIPEVRRSLDEIGIDLPTEEVRQYAQHICDRADYELVLH
ncbi:hypothetical protein [Aeromicrobium sp. NPDC092404]|uniref:hypothetical protein n=1 Tax=Aeromicrobium sp. NPDC092404 TaxID=3154976 RepID=UPI0034379936